MIGAKRLIMSTLYADTAKMSAKVIIVIPCPIHQDGRVKQLTTASTLPSTERANKIIEFFGEHATLAAWTLHRNDPPNN